MSFDREYCFAVGIGKIHAERYPTLNIALPLDDADENHAVLAGRKIRRLQLAEYSVDIQFPVRSGSGIRTKEKDRFH